jgi:hypothetical protein
MGMTVLDSEHLKYAQKKGWDCEVRINGERCKVEIKFDAMSETTGNVCLEIPALRQSVSPIWIIGLPQGPKIDLYTAFLKDLLPYAEAHPNKRLVGEFRVPAALPSKTEFISQPFIKHFKTINL